MADIDSMYHAFAAEYNERIPELLAAAEAWKAAQYWFSYVALQLNLGELQLVDSWPDDAGELFKAKLQPSIAAIRNWSVHYQPGGFFGTITTSGVIQHIDALVAGIREAYPRVEAIWKTYDNQVRNGGNLNVVWLVNAITEMSGAIRGLDPLYAAVTTGMKAAVGGPWPGPVAGTSPGGAGGTDPASGLGPEAGDAGSAGADPGAVDAPAPGEVVDPDQFEPGEVGSPAASGDAGSGSDAGADALDALSQDVPSPGDIEAGEFDPWALDPANAPDDLTGYPSLAGGDIGGIGGGGGMSTLSPLANPVSAGAYDASMTPPTPSTTTGAAGGATARGTASAMPMMFPPYGQGANPGGGVKPGAAGATNAQKLRKPGVTPGVALSGRATPGLTGPGRSGPAKGIRAPASPDDEQVLDEELWQVHPRGHRTGH
ncbi:hypothetical protein KZZ52_18695 [Dactylosporangium sp. AC04546]|uniref:hypothetical protein n=1 Tax=Dactylosporangium sp. AC04546 TaxID=2862460 RepID=UPI001EDF8463|nr:hypothetical protein [Dactylosporangium sp. AC04546]WVK87332.1 hypothetical protein KZZ52_18695 [Dactylosporangium sp. AC04546]